MAKGEGGGQERSNRNVSETADETTPEVAKALGEAAVGNKTSTEDVDDLLDEIDDVLEQNAEEFVKSYVQKGGE
jgi:prokaryotic ubiquitin-like protein Pup